MLASRASRQAGGPAVKDKKMPVLDVLLRPVPEGFEFLAVLITVFASIMVMVAFGKWWER